ncbi:permease [Clostridium aceticum]|uniref:Permease n=1 Tax=Clostridium aceticum TaxID=84022 RepID=A0A0D8IEC2_9CLOT|nr:AEC family transporter [Clostridium aceticum]AKL93933.1 permease [Clostridium aceticum]KJF28680.1 hypothetical protein TZ02_01905 [Clostridium aceticum]
MEIFYVVNQVTVLAILMIIGYITRKKEILSDQLSNGLSSILIYIALPAMIISAFHFEFSIEMFKNIGLILILSTLIHVLLVVVNKLIFKKYEVDKRNVLNYFGIFPNAGFMGLPFILALYGETGVFYASIFMIPYHVLMWTYGQRLFAKAKDPSFMKALIIHPSILAIVIGLLTFIFSVNIPYVILRPMNMLSSMTTPIAMMIIGGKIADLKFHDLFSDKDVYIGCFVRLIVAPILTFALLKGMNLDFMLIKICVTIEVIPAAMTIVIFPEKYGGDTHFATKCVLMSHVLSIITIPIVFLLLQ